MGNTARILAILPAYNEADSLPHVIRDLRAGPLPVDIVVVDDGSKDATTAVAQGLGVNVLTLPFNLGIGGAVQTGFRFAHARGYDIALQFDSDGQHFAAEIPALVAPLLAGAADVVVGSRFAERGNGGYRGAVTRRAGGVLLSTLIYLLSGARYTDVTSGFRAYNARALNVVVRDYPQDFPEPESLLTCRRYALRVAEVQVAMGQRVAGVSSLASTWKSLYYMIKVSLALCVERLRARERGVSSQ